MRNKNPVSVKQKSSTKAKRLIIGCLSLSLLLSGCAEKIGDYKQPVFQTKYTEEEHIQRISQQTEAIFEEEIDSGKLLKYNVEIVYAFYDEDPEYFLVELEYVDECIKVTYENPNYSLDTGKQEPQYIEQTTRYQHFIGFIENDNYKTGLPHYDSGSSNTKQCFMAGRSAYALYMEGKGEQYGKKYYGGRVQGIERSGEIIVVAGMDCYENGIEWHQHTPNSTYTKCNIGDVVPENLYENYMHSNYKLFIRLYQ